jgi:hypothetical protein
VLIPPPPAAEIGLEGFGRSWVGDVSVPTPGTGDTAFLISGLPRSEFDPEFSFEPGMVLKADSQGVVTPVDTPVETPVGVLSKPGVGEICPCVRVDALREKVGVSGGVAWYSNVCK